MRDDRDINNNSNSIRSKLPSATMNGFDLNKILLVKLFNPATTEVCPEEYLAGAGQLLALMLVSCWSTTYFFNHDIIVTNPIKTRIGYNNLCIGFDSPPACYIAQYLTAPASYLAYSFGLHDWKRTQLVESRLTSRQRYFSVVTDVLFVLSISIFGLLFLVNPFVSLWVHSAVFLQYVFFRWLVVAANLFELRRGLTLGNKVWFGAYTLASVGMPVLILIDYVAYDYYGHDGPIIPWYFTWSMDYLWFGCLALSGMFFAKGEALDHSGIKIVPTYQRQATSDFA